MESTQLSKATKCCLASALAAAVVAFLLRITNAQIPLLFAFLWLSMSVTAALCVHFHFDCWSSQRHPRTLVAVIMSISLALLMNHLFGNNSRGLTASEVAWLITLVVALSAAVIAFGRRGKL
jgi:hypothetical protein